MAGTEGAPPEPRAEGPGNPKRRRRFSQDLKYGALGLGGLSVGAVVLTLRQIDPAAGLDEVIETGNFVATIEFETWLFMMSALTALCAIVVPPLTRALRYSTKRTTIKRSELAVGIAALLAPIIVLQVFFQTTSPLYMHYLRVNALIAPAVLVGACCLAGILMTQAATKRDLSTRKLNGQVALLERLHDQLRFYLIVAGAIVGLATLARGALREALVAAGQPPTNLEKGEILIYGLYLSLVLAVAYLPARLALRKRSRRLLRDHFPMPADPNGLQDWETRRSIVAALLRADANVKEELESGLAILGPLAGSGVALLLGT